MSDIRSMLRFKSSSFHNPYFSIKGEKYYCTVFIKQAFIFQGNKDEVSNCSTAREVQFQNERTCYHLAVRVPLNIHRKMDSKQATSSLIMQILVFITKTPQIVGYYYNFMLLLFYVTGDKV